MKLRREYDFFMLIIPLIVFLVNHRVRFGDKIPRNKIVYVMVTVDVAYVFIISKIFISISGLITSVCGYIFDLFFYATIVVVFVVCNKHREEVA